VIPESIPDWLALVGDSADGYPGLPGWGAKTAAALLRHYVHASAIPDDATAWEVPVRGAGRLAQTLVRGREALALFLDLATLRLDATLLADGVESLRWVGPTAAFAGICDVLHAPYLAARAAAVAAARS
jgi:5'-3' exonuclease